MGRQLPQHERPRHLRRIAILKPGGIHFHPWDFVLYQVQREVHARQQGRRVDPLRIEVGITGRFLFAVERFAQLSHLVGQGEPIFHVGIQGPDGAGYHLKGRLDFGAEGTSRPEFPGIQHGAHHFADVAALGQEGLGHAVHQRGRRIIGHESLRQLGGDELGGGRMRR